MAALRAAVFPLSAKNRRGGHFLPPSSARVNEKFGDLDIGTSFWSFISLFHIHCAQWRMQ